MLLVLVLCALCPAALSTKAGAAGAAGVHAVLPEAGDDRARDMHEETVRNYVSAHELPKDVPTRVKIVGDLGTPPPGVPLDFVPQQSYVQVRRYDAVKRLPQEAALEEAATAEEAANAPRLREVVSHKKTQQVYEEQGYEDAGYDHGGSKKLKIEEEVKDTHNVDVIRSNNSSPYSAQETKESTATVAPSGRGTWSRHKSSSGRKTRFEDDGGRGKLTTKESTPTSEKTSGNFSKFDGGRTIVVQNLTSTEKKDNKDSAESRQVSSVSKTATDNVEPTTYRPAGRHESFRHSTKPLKNDGQKRNRSRNRPRKNNEDAEHQQSNADVVGSYDNTPWVPIAPPKDWSTRPQFQTKKHLGKSKVNSEMNEPGGHGMRFGFTVHHDNPYQYVYPADTSGHATKQSAKPIRFKPEISEVIMGKPKGPQLNYYEFTPETNYDGSAINQKPKKNKATGSSSTDQINLSTTSNYKDPVSKYKPDSTHISQYEGSAIRQRPKTKPVQQEAFVEYFNSYPKPESPRNEKNKGHRDIESELGISANSGSRYIPTDHAGLGSNTKYESPFYTKRPKPVYNTDSTGDYNVHDYPKFELYPGTQNKFVVKEKSPSTRPSINLNTGTSNSEFSYVPPHVNKHEGPRLSDYPKFNSRPKNVYRESLESSESWENYPKTKPVYQSSEESYSKRGGNSEEYPKFDHRNKGGDSTRSKSNHMYRLVPYQKQMKLNNMYSYVQHDDHYPSGSHQSSVKTEVAAPSLTVAKKDGYVNNRHPFLPKDSLKNNQYEHKSEDDNTKHVENLTLAHFAGLHKSGSHRPLPIEYNERVNNLAKLLNDNYPRSRTRRDLEVIHIASSGTTTEIPVDTVVYPHYKHAPKQSAIRYATNPNLKPRKTEGGMEFYESTDKVRCDDVSGPADVVPERIEDGEWKGEPRAGKPRVEDVGDKIGCFKTKFFGEDPLDNPFFKEKTVGFPDVLYSEKKPLRNQENVDPNLDWNFAEELIPGQWFPDKDKRTRRSGNESLPNNHKIQGMDSILPEPVILTFPTKATTVVYNINDTKSNTENGDTQGSSNQAHLLKYSIRHPVPRSESTKVKNNLLDSKIFGLIPPPQLKKKPTNPVKLKTPSVKKLLKKVKVEDDSDEDGLLDVLSPISFFLNDDDYAAPVVHNFFNIKMSAPPMLQTNTMVDGSSGENLNKMYLKSYRRQKRNMQGVDLQKPRERNINFNANTNLTVSPATSRVRMYSTENGTWLRNKRDQTSVNVDVRRKEPRYYYHTPRPRVRVKRVVYNPPPTYSRSGQVFSSKYLIPDQDNVETLPEEINVAFSTTPKYSSNTQFIPAIAFGDSKTKVIQYNDSVANSTNGVERAQIDRNNSLIYVINPDTGVGKWMQVIKVKNDEDARSSFGHGPIYLEKKTKPEDHTRYAVGNGPTLVGKKVKVEGDGKTSTGNGPVFLEKKVKDGLAEETVGKFGFKGLERDFFKNLIKSPLSHRFALKDALIKAPKKEEQSEDEPKKVICPVIKQMKRKEVRRRPTTTEIPVVEEVEDRPVEQSGEEESPEPQEEEGGGGEGGGEEEEEAAEVQNEEDHTEQPAEQNESEERPEENEEEQQQYQDQDLHESKRKKPFFVAKKPEFYGYHLHPRQRRKQKRE